MGKKYKTTFSTFDLCYENFKSGRQVIIEIVRKLGGSAIGAGSSTHRDRLFVFAMPCRSLDTTNKDLL